MHFFAQWKPFLFRPQSSSRSRLWGTQGAGVYTRPSLAPAGLRGACSGLSKSRELACNHGIAFRRARATQDNGKPTI